MNIYRDDKASTPRFNSPITAGSSRKPKKMMLNENAKYSMRRGSPEDGPQPPRIPLTTRIRTAACRESTRPRMVRERMKAIAADEMSNARAALAIYAKAPWLDIANRLDGYFSPCEAMIREKMRWIEAFLKS